MNENKLDYWPFAIGPFVTIVVYTLYFLNLTSILGKNIQENIHLGLIIVAFIVFFVNAIKEKEIFRFIMSALCFSFLCREIHFVGTSLGVYIAIAIIAIWAISKWKQVELAINQGKIKPWLYATGFTYILSQLIARRLLRSLHVPYEQNIHVLLEETVETVAHSMMLITAIITCRTKTSVNQAAAQLQNQPK